MGRGNYPVRHEIDENHSKGTKTCERRHVVSHNFI